MIIESDDAGSNVSFRLGGKRLSITKEDKEKSLLTPGKASELSTSSTTTETKNDNGFFAHVDSTRTATAILVTETSLSKEAAAKKELPASESAHSAAKKELPTSESAHSAAKKELPVSEIAHSAAKKELPVSESAHSTAKKEVPASESAHAAATRNHSSSWASISAGGAGHTNGHQTDTAPGTSRNSSTDDIGSDIIYLLSQARKGRTKTPDSDDITMSALKDRAFESVKAVDRLTPLEDTDREEGPSSMRDVSGDKPVSSGEINGSATAKGSNSHLFHTADETKDSKQNKVDSQNSSNGNSKGSHQSLSLNFFSKSPETRPLLSSSSTSPTSPTSASPPQTPASTVPTSAATNFQSNSSEPSASPEEGTPLSDVEKLKQKINSMTSANALGNGKSSSHPEFHHLKSAMKHSGEDGKKGKRKMSLLDTVMRRVSIHRKDSTPSGRIATFFFGSAEDAMKEDSEEEEGRDNGDTDVEGKGHSDEHGHHSGKTAAERKQHQVAILKENLFMILSGLYGVVIVILGAVLPITEIFVKNEKERSFEAFYLYLYIVSIIFLVYVYAYLLRRNRLKTEFLTRTLSRSLSWTRNWAKSWAKADEATKGKLRKRMTSLDVDNHHTGTFYLRLGVLGFGIGSMIHSGLNFGKFFAVTEAACQEALDAVKPLFHLVFTFFQLYFIFMNSKMCIHRYKRLARFGLMHMCATNICVWFQSIVVETLHVIHMHHHNSHQSDHGSGGGHGGGHGEATSHPDDDHGHDDHLGPTASPHKILSTTIKVGRRLHAAVSSSSNHHDVNSSSSTCEMSGMMNDAVEAAGPYLYPCTIEYSLMCAGILYIMWKNVGNKPKRHHPSDSDDDDHERVHRMSVDCTSSSRGLFLGILMMVGTIISIIAFYMLVNSENMQLSGLILTHLSETFIYTVTMIAILLAAWKMKNLTFHNEHEIDLEDILVLISYTGLLVFIIFSLVASILHTPADTRSALTILSNIFMLLQSTAQTLFMLAGDRMTASDELQQRKKPGREFITFLLISNFAMWAVNTFETQTPQHNPIQVEFYGNDAWAIFTHVSVPLGIYYRFHSTVCFSNIWKNAWKIRKHGHGHG